MYATFHLGSNELDVQFLEALQRLYPDRQLVITVETEPTIDEIIEQNPAYKKHLEKSIEQINRGEVVRFESVEALIKKLEG